MNQFIDYESTDTSQIAIQRQYGSIAAYREHKEIEQWKGRMSKSLQDLDIAKKVYRKSVTNYAIFFPTDTAGIVSRWLNEAYDSSNMTAYQRTLLREQIMEKIRGGWANYKVLAFLEHFSFDILLILLPNEQYGQYFKNIYLKKRWLESRASTRLFNYFQGELHLNSKQIEEAYRQILLTK
ncbi:hypothetical protein [Spirosoma telluris]|uniref:hypothetical protein n=1 Tax=Spirosoma telluris TaxID=2183553 RepID=UPI0018DB1DD3